MKFQYGAWLRVPKPKRPVSQWPRGRVASVEDESPLPSPTPFTTSHTKEVHFETRPTDTVATAVASIPTCTPAVDDIGATIAAKDVAILDVADKWLAIPSSPLVSDDHIDVVDVDSFVDVETFLVSFDGVVQPVGVTLVDSAVKAAADEVLREVAIAVVAERSLPPAPPSPVGGCRSPDGSRSAPARDRKLPLLPFFEESTFQGMAPYLAQVNIVLP
ncbi:hypothetical protein V6N13_048745 [Hibiscus sabdariffa]|uniref:Uncharacterized protein n=1 Tax=Hibiscus sabdariffa TaxID=183260 RepID=A0ABR2DIN5_9ROSI